MEQDKQREAQSLYMELQMLEAQSQEGQRQLNALKGAREEIDSATAAIEGTAASGKKMFPVGAGAYLPATTQGDKVLIELGAGVVAEKTREEAKKILANRAARIDEALKKIGDELNRISSKAEAAAGKLEKLRQ